MRPLAVGGKHARWPHLTVVTVAGNVVFARVEAALDHTIRWRTSWDYSEVASRADEGVTWIRGYHQGGSPEWAALTAAFRLARSAA